MLKIFFWFLMPLMFWAVEPSSTADPNPNVVLPTSTANPDEPPVTEPAKKEGEKITFTQDQLDGIIAGRAKQASSKATADLLAELGVEDINAAKALLAEADKARKEQMTELEQAQEQARLAQEAQAKAEADAAERERLANEKLMQSAVIAEASKADYKLRPEVLNDLWLFVTGELKEKLTVNDGGEVTGVDEVVKEIIKDRDYWIADATTSPGTTTRQKRQAMQRKAIEQQQQQTEEYRPLINF